MDAFISNWQPVLFCMVQAAGYLMIGLWLLEAHRAHVPAPSSVTIYTDDYRERVSHLPKENETAEASLKTYRSLVDSGLMTEAEFQEKKRQLLEK